MRLEELDLSDYSLEILPDTLGLLTRLQRLDVSDCISLTELPRTLGHMTNLRWVAYYKGCRSKYTQQRVVARRMP